MRMIKWGVLGTAGIAKGCTIPGMVQAENCELYAIAGRSMEKAVAYQKEFGFEKAYDSYEELLADPEVEAVYIPLPNTLHCEWAIKALNAKKHVLCEKPLAPSVADMEKMFKAAEENGVMLMEAFAYLHSPLIKAIKAELESGVIGDVDYIESAFLTSDYDISNIRMRKETCGGSVYDLGVYDTSFILWMLGKYPEKVQAIAEFSDENVDNLAAVLMNFGGRTKAAFNCGMVMATEKDHRLDRNWIRGSKGHIRTDAEFNQCGTLTYTVVADGKETVKTVETPQNYKLEVEQLGRCIAGEETPYITKEFSLMNGKLIDEILEKIGY